ncbi:MAG: hypothetical protein FWD09_09355 [Lentimicrobiaceae bacterium]|nr:hypothetical protein [Lentimicrobiaceae bacterium]
MRTILVNYGIKKEIMADLGCTYPTIKTALNYKSDMALSNKIRLRKLEK